MPSFLCCTSSARSLAISPEDALPLARCSATKGVNGSATAVRVEAPAKHKLQTLLDDTLLPGQLPGTPGAAAPGRGFDADTKTGVPLLEDTLCSSTNARSHVTALGAQGVPVLQPGPVELVPDGPPHAGRGAVGSRLHIPAHLQSTSASFSADYRDGEQVMSPASFSEAPPCRPSASGDGAAVGDAGRPVQRGSRASASASSRCCDAPGPSLESLWLLLEPPLLRSVSRRSGQRRLCRLFPRSSTPDPPKVPVAGNLTAAAASRGDVIASAGPGPPLSRASCSCVGLALLQQELLTAEALPCCPLLLLPHRVYEQPDIVHVVYDSAGDFMDLHSYLRAQQRLPEASCRSVMRQLLQALSVLHERRWVHRNVNTETVWVTDSQPGSAAAAGTGAPIQKPPTQSVAESGSRPHALEPLQLLDPTDGALSEGATTPTPRPQESPPEAAAVAAPSVAAAAPAAARRTRVSTVSSVSLAPSIVTHGALSAGAGAAAAGGSSDPSGSSKDGGSRRPGGWLAAGDDVGPLAAEPPERPSCCGCATSTDTSTSSCCSTAATGQPLARRKPQPQPHHQQQWKDQQQQLQVKLGGLALAVRPEVDPGSGREAPLRELTGCAYHLAPEAISGAGYGRPADVWAAGVLLYMLLTGRPPFTGANELEVMTRILLAATESSTNRRASGQQQPQQQQPGGPAKSTATAAEPFAAEAPPARPSTPPPPPLSATTAASAQLPGQPVPSGHTSPPTDNRRSSGGRTAAAVSVTQASGSRGGAGAGSGGGGGQGWQEAGASPFPPSPPPPPPPPPRSQLRELAAQAVSEAAASCGCGEVLAGMLVADPERRMTAAELLRLPWFLRGSEEEG